MNRARMCGTALLGLLVTGEASAHALAGARVFVPTLTMDDPGMADEAALPTGQWQRRGVDADGSGPSQSVQMNVEIDKRITENLGIGVNWGGTALFVAHGKNNSGMLNLAVTGKYQAYVNPQHEFIASVGVVRSFGGTGALRVGADATGSTTPTLYVGKGFGDLPIGPLRALGVTGELAYTIPDRRINATLDNNGLQAVWAGGVSLQYSLAYLKDNVKDYGLPDFVNRLVPTVEVTWSSAGARSPGYPTQLLYAVGAFYMADNYDIGVELLVPGNRATGTNLGVIAQLHLFLDDLFPTTLGRPIFGGEGVR